MERRDGKYGLIHFSGTRAGMGASVNKIYVLSQGGQKVQNQTNRHCSFLALAFTK
jgi:hypothetical protein